MWATLMTPRQKKHSKQEGESVSRQGLWKGKEIQPNIVRRSFYPMKKNEETIESMWNFLFCPYIGLAGVNIQENNLSYLYQYVQS